jgi:hypothetical protein
MTDPLVEEARRAGQAYIDSFKGDLKAACADLRRRARRGSQCRLRCPETADFTGYTTIRV